MCPRIPAVQARTDSMLGEDASAGAGAWRPRYLSVVLLACTLTLSTIVIVRGITVGEFSYNTDESQHAASGLFYASIMRDHPSHPVEYTYRYYAQYPALSGVVHWPPVYYCFEAAFFLLGGPSVVAARLSILFFTLIALTFWFLLIRDLLDPWTAAFATVLLATLPTILLLEKAVMLELPVLAFIMGATYFWWRYLDRERTADVFAAACFTGLALLTKQTAIYLLPFLLISAVWVKGVRWLWRREIFLAFALVVVLAAPYYALVVKLHWKTVAMDLDDQSGPASRQWLFYGKALISQLGWTFFPLSVLGAITSRRWSRPTASILMASWMFSCWLTLTLIGYKEARYGIFLLPPAIYFVAGLLLRNFRAPLLRRIVSVATVCLVAISLAEAWKYQRPFISGYAAAARTITKSSTSGVILFDGKLAANFIFFLRANDPGRHFLVLRKALYAMRLKRRGGVVELVHNTEDLQKVVSDYGVSYFVVSEGIPLEFPPQQILRDYLKTSAVTEVGRFPVTGDALGVRDSSLVLYRTLKLSSPSSVDLQIKMLTLDHDISVPLNELGPEDEGAKKPPGR